MIFSTGKTRAITDLLGNKLPGFDAQYYARTYPDVGISTADLQSHFLNIGWKEGKNPSPYFDTVWYLNEYPDVQHAGINPLIHYLIAGLSEGRRAIPGVMAVNRHDNPEYLVRLDDNGAAQIERFNQEYEHAKSALVGVIGTNHVYRCRPCSTDIPVIFDTLAGLYHVPQHPLPEAPIIVDLGSNIGCTLVHYGKTYTPKTMIGVELDTANFEICQENAALNNIECKLVNAAIWSSDGEVNYGGQEEWEFSVSQAGHNRVRSISMQTLMASFSIDRIDFLKIDIEGGELELLRGDIGWLSKVNQIHLEVHYGDAELAALTEILTRGGLRVERDTRHWSALIARR